MMNDLSDIGLLRRELRDVRAVVANMDQRRRKPVQPGEQLVALAAARLARLIGNTRAADFLEAKAIASPAMTTIATWAAELMSSALPGFILTLDRRSALAGILSPSPQVSCSRSARSPCRLPATRHLRSS